MTILAIDPGTTDSAYVLWDGTLRECGHLSNDEMLARIMAGDFFRATHCAIEMIASYGMAVGVSTFETVFWIGRFYQEARKKMECRRVFRKDIKIHLCGSMKANDGNIRQALIDKHGDVGSKKRPGSLFGVSKHVWAALAVADYAACISEEPSQAFGLERSLG